MDLFDLGYVPWLDSQLIYHAQPRLGVEGLNILAPREPYVCIGYHQDVEQEVDLAFCRGHGIPVFRREVGGGAVYLDGKQIFFQLVLHKDNPAARGGKQAFYQRLLQPVAETYSDLGVPARYRPVNDVITETGRKISGTGVAEIGDFMVLVGNLIEDFDYETMSRVLKVPDEKYRDKVFKSIQENLTTLRRETGRTFGWVEMVNPLVRRFEAVLGGFRPSVLPDSIRAEVEALAPVFQSEEWLYKKGKRLPQGRDVKIASGVNVVQRMHKAAGGLLRSLVEIKDGRFSQVSLSGDFFCYPKEAVGILERMLEGAPFEGAGDALGRFYSEQRPETPGVTVQDWLTVLGVVER